MILEKVTPFITRRAPGGLELLVFQHPTAGVQLPAGTVEIGEDPAAAALREAQEESGLRELRLVCAIGQQEHLLPETDVAVCQTTTVYSRPDPGSFDWASLPRGARVRVERRVPGYLLVTFEEGDRYPDPQYISYQITGWAPEAVLGQVVRRYFFHLEFTGQSPADGWEVPIDCHIFRPFWLPWANLQMDDCPILSNQHAWLDYAQNALGYDFHPIPPSR